MNVIVGILTLTLTWEYPWNIPTPAHNPQAFIIERREGSGPWMIIGGTAASISSELPPTTYVDTTAKPGVKYTYRVLGRNNSDLNMCQVVGPWSNEASNSTGTVPSVPPPTMVTLSAIPTPTPGPTPITDFSASKLTASSVRLGWTSGGQTICVQRKTATTQWKQISKDCWQMAGSWDDAGVSAGTYWYRLTDTKGTAISNEASVSI